jgi:O-antigen ligase/polysaccharide polymerase Wzy-like membrane protein
VPPPRSRPEALRGALTGSPAILLVALGLAALLVVAPSNGGYGPSAWYPAALFVLGLLAVGLLAMPRARQPVPAVRVACLALAGYAAWSYLSILWAQQQGDAWDGANRTALYAILFALFALWPVPGRAAALLIGGFALVIAVVGLVNLLGAAGAADPSGYFIDGRFASPAGYANADAALWSSAFWPCVVLGSRRQAVPLLRGVLIFSAVLLGGLALMGQSRGWLFALPVVAAIFLVATPRRVRTSLTLLLAVAGVAVTIPAVLDVYDKTGPTLARAMDSGARAILLAALATGLVAALAGIADRRVRASREGGRRMGAALVAAAAAAALAGSVVYVAERGSPFTDIAHAWNQFKTKRTPYGGTSRLGRLGSDRYDFWRVALQRFEHAPLAGIGADNYQEAYLRHGKSQEQPLYPHSVELRTLSQTGLVGAVLLVGAWAGAMVASALALRRRAGWGAAAAAAGVGAFTYWAVHGSVDWLWEFPVLGGTAFALLGLAAGLAPRAPARPGSAGRPLVSGPLPVAAAALVGIVLALTFAGPWLSDRYVSQAVSIWRLHPARAFDRLDSAASLNPLSPRPRAVAGSIALRLGRLGTAERYFRQALDRDSDYAYSYLELGAIAVDTGRRSEGVRLLAQAVALEPRDVVARKVLRQARRGRTIDIARMNEALRRRTLKLGR